MDHTTQRASHEFNFLMEKGYFVVISAEQFPSLIEKNVKTLLKRDLKKILEAQAQNTIPFLHGGKEAVRQRVISILEKQGYTALQHAGIEGFSYASKDKDLWIRLVDVPQPTYFANSYPPRTEILHPLPCHLQEQTRAHSNSAPPAYVRENTSPGTMSTPIQIPQTVPLPLNTSHPVHYGIPPNVSPPMHSLHAPQSRQFHWHYGSAPLQPSAPALPVQTSSFGSTPVWQHASIVTSPVQVSLDNNEPMQDNLDPVLVDIMKPENFLQFAMDEEQMAPNVPNLPIKYDVVRTYEELNQIVENTQKVIEFYCNSFYESYKDCKIVEYLKRRRQWQDDNAAKVWLEGLICDSLSELYQNKQTIWVLATRGADIIGLVIVDIQPNNKYYLAHYAVHPAYWGTKDENGKTLAEKLAQFSFSRTTIQNGSEVYGFVRKMNVRAIPFYTKIGATRATFDQEDMVEHYNPEEYHKFVLKVH